MKAQGELFGKIRLGSPPCPHTAFAAANREQKGNNGLIQGLHCHCHLLSAPRPVPLFPRLVPGSQRQQETLRYQVVGFSWELSPTCHRVQSGAGL